MQVSVKWNKLVFPVELSPEEGVQAFKAILFSLTNVPVERQKLMAKGAWPGILKDDQDLTKCSISEGLSVTLMGTADVVVSKPSAEVKFIEDMTAEEQAKAGTILPAGLINLGNTCYMNSTLQCLRYIEGFRKLVSNVPTSSLAHELSQLYNELDRSASPVIPGRFLQILRTHFPQFAEARDGRYMQQDADELLGSVTSSVGQVVPNFSQFVSTIGFEMEETLTCEESADEAPVKSKDTTFKLICNIQGGSGSSVAVDHLADGIKLGLEGHIEKFSSVLQRDARWTRKQRINSLPNVICIQFMRFFWKPTPESTDHAGLKCKILRAVTFTEVRFDKYSSAHN